MSKNWTEAGTETLMEAYGARKAILEGRLGADLTFHAKKRAWKAVVEAVNAVGNEQRTGEQIKKRWKNLVTAARKTILEWKREKATKLYARLFNIRGNILTSGRFRKSLLSI